MEWLEEVRDGGEKGELDLNLSGKLRPGTSMLRVVARHPFSVMTIPQKL